MSVQKWLGFVALFALPARLDAQVRTDTVRAAVALRDASQFTEAAALLEAYVAAHPANGDAARMLSETLYWSKNVSAARAVAESALVHFPEDTSLRLQYGAMLVDVADARRARELLTPLLDSPRRARAAALLGKLAYWSGDLSTARQLFVESLHSAPDQAEVRRQLGEILEADAPSASSAVSFTHDDQPIDVLALKAASDWYLTPLSRVTAGVMPMMFRLADTSTRTMTLGEIDVADYLPSVRLDFDLAAGGLQRSFGSSTDWTARLSTGVRLPGHVAVRGRVEREPYRSTEASLSTPVMTNTAAILAQLSSPRGWLGEAALQSQRYPDANTVTSAYVWLLAPLVHADAGDLQIGYSGVHENAAESRFTSSGRYAPYYTPNDLTSQSVIAAAMGRLSQRFIARVNGAFAVRATDNVLTFRGPIQIVSPRTFTPWNARVSIDASLANGLSVGAGAEKLKGGYYTSATIDVHATYRFSVAARRAAVGY